MNDPIEKIGILRPRPYARLLNMLSDQLIKDNTVALSELAKNSYDADADWVQIRVGNMQNFGKSDLSDDQEPFVEIEDNGDGMSFQVVREAWMNPATPSKLNKKELNGIVTRRGRILQGEKGIGRYAVFQIGKVVEIYTRERIGEQRGGEEVFLKTDLTVRPITFPGGNYSKKATGNGVVYFDEIEASYERTDGKKIVPHGIVIQGEEKKTGKHGTLIRITKLNYAWDLANIEKVRKVLSRLQSPFRKKDFAISIIFNESEITKNDLVKVNDLFEEATLRCEGSVDRAGVCTLTINNKNKRSINLVEVSKEDWVPENKLHFFLNTKEGYRQVKAPSCGAFSFEFYVYDLDKLDKETKKFVKEHRTYIYRDGIRVYPYGDADNDWIKLDIYRGIHKASYYLSNDSVIGYIQITSANNPGLMDKTSREGLIEQTGAFEDIRVLVLAALSVIKQEFQRITMSSSLRPKRRKDRIGKLYLQSEKVRNSLDLITKHLTNQGDSRGQQLVLEAVKQYISEKELLEKQIEIVEDLAGVGMAVDATSHDLMALTLRLVERAEEVVNISSSSKPNVNIISARVKELSAQLKTVYDLIEGIQPLFRSARRKNVIVSLIDIIEKVERYYKRPIQEADITIDIRDDEKPLKIRSSEGVLLQIFINLFDNAVYWLKAKNVKNPEIRIVINTEQKFVTFADNGSGIPPDNADYIFEPFFSTKGLDGRGLGLYIAQQLADKSDYQFYLITDESEMILPGANFRLDFNPSESNT